MTRDKTPRGGIDARAFGDPDPEPRPRWWTDCVVVAMKNRMALSRYCWTLVYYSNPDRYVSCLHVQGSDRERKVRRVSQTATMSAQVKASQTSKKVHLRRYTVACMRTVMCPKHLCSMHRSGGLELIDHMVVTAAAILARYVGTSCK
jgi:hypothetical protein